MPHTQVRSGFVREAFRSNINGLRAWAVSFVMFYHFGIPGFAGGFVGVDVFFVISGFLMTGIITRGLERGDFSVLSFYLARAKRILPALLVLCTVLLIAGWWLLPSPEYRMLGTHSTFSLLFLANIKFWLEAGYFDAASHEKWLLHTWSLAVEWQFYLLLPLVLLLAWKRRPSRNTIFLTLLAGLLASLALSTTLTQGHPSAAFYLLPTRAWEMLAGGLISLLPTGRESWSRALELTGMSAIVASVALFDSSTPWPGWYALLPVTGTMLVLKAARADSLWTGNRVAQWLGNCSYSLYLWHWPVVVVLFYTQQQDNAYSSTLGILATLAIGHISYITIENNIKSHLDSLAARRAASLIAALASCASLTGVAIGQSKGFPTRLPPEIEQVSRESENIPGPPDYCDTEIKTNRSICFYGKGDLKAIIIGDSHAHMLVTALKNSIPDQSGSVMELTHVSCPTLYGIQRTDYGPEHKCAEFNSWAKEKLSTINSGIPLIIANRTSSYLKGRYGAEMHEKGPIVMEFQDRRFSDKKLFEAEYAKRITETACDFAKNRLVYMIQPIPEMGVDVPKVASRLLSMHLDANIAISLKDYQERHQTVLNSQSEARRNCNIKLLDPRPFLCPNNQCHGIIKGQSLYIDDNHLSERGSQILTPMFRSIFQ